MKIIKSAKSGVFAGLAFFSAACFTQASTPYSGTPIAIPGIIEMEDYDLGGEGDAYHDVDAGNNGSASYRTDDVDHETCSEGGFNVGWTVTGDWLKYTVNVASNGNYTITSRVAAGGGTGAFHIEVDDVDVTGTISVPNTGGWQTWVDKTSVVALNSGQQVVKLVIEAGDVNINKFTITANDPAPSAPTGLQVDDAGTNSVSLSWTASTTGDPTTYNVKRSTASNGTYSVVGAVAAPTVNFTDSVTGGSTYYYVVSGESANGEGDDSAVVFALPILGSPHAPTGLVASASDSQVDLSWAVPMVGNPTSYNVLRSTTSGSGYAAITTPGAQTTTSFTDTTVTNGTTYYYVVTAVNAAGESTNSSEADATPVAFATIYEPFDYTALEDGTPSSGEGFSGNWNCGLPGAVVSGLNYPGLPVSDNALQSSGWRQSVQFGSPISSGTKWISFLYKKSFGDSGGNINGVYFPNGGTGLWFGFGLAPVSGTQGNLGIGTVDTTGNGATFATSTLELLELGTYGDTYLVVLKIDFDTSGNNDTITVYLNPTANLAEPDVAPAGTHSAFDVGTISGIGLNVTGSGEIIVDEIRVSDSYTGVIDAVVDPPSAPTSLVATPGSNSVSLAWAEPAGHPTSYNIKRSTTSGGSYTVIDTTSGTSFSEDILGGQTYYYVVSAVNEIGEGDDSSEASVTPILAAPGVPTGLQATAGDAEVELSWNSTTFATGYAVMRSTEVDGAYIEVGTTIEPSVTFVDSFAANGTTYYYTVRATGSSGAGADSAPVSATPLAPVPLIAGLHQGIGVSWMASNSVTYRVQWTAEDMGTNTVWVDVGDPILGSGETNTVFIPVGEEQPQYRVISIQ